MVRPTLLSETTVTSVEAPNNSPVGLPDLRDLMQRGGVTFGVEDDREATDRCREKL